MVPESILTPTTEGHWKFQGGVVLKAKLFNGKYLPKLKFPEGWGVQSKIPSLGGVWISSGTTQSILLKPHGITPERIIVMGRGKGLLHGYELTHLHFKTQ